jgi:3-oxoacyl-[acyl-carrier protein] reductase
MTSQGKRLVGKKAVITGASRGIGAAVARAFAAEGADLALAYARTPEMEKLARDLADELSATGVNAVAIAADLASADEPGAIIRQAREALGPISTIVANAAANWRAPFDEYSIADWDLINNVNVRSTWLMAKEAKRDLITTQGSIITVSSILAHNGNNTNALYVTSKMAVIGLTRALARELGPDGVRANCVAPGAIRTEWEIEFDPDPEAVKEAVYAKQALQMRGFAKDLAGTFVFLASDQSSFITGQTITVDGGWMMK